MKFVHMYEPQKFDHLLGMTGFSDDLLTTHFGLYEGYVKNTNALIEHHDKLMKENKNEGPVFAETRRRFGWEFSGMRLHELYFGNLSAESKANDAAPELMKQIETDFGSFDDWHKDFMATGAMRGIGWAVLYYDPVGKRLFNTWINEHELGHLPGNSPLLVLDVFEHAFFLDYGANRADYIQAFFNAVDWEEINKRFVAAS